MKWLIALFALRLLGYPALIVAATAAVAVSFLPLVWGGHVLFVLITGVLWVFAMNATLRHGSKKRSTGTD